MNTVKIIVISTLAYLIAVAVILSSLHVRDIVGHSNTINGTDAARTTKVHAEDVSAKAIGELHNHVEKTMVKSLMKSLNDTATVNRQRETLEESLEADQPLAVRLMEVMLMFRLTYAFTLAR